VLLPDGSRLTITETSDTRATAIRDALNSVPRDGVAIRTVVSSSDKPLLWR
jgi:hypothetical protein